MKKYPERRQLDLPKTASEIFEFWKSEQIFEQTQQNQAGKKPFVFYEGPPSANGLPGIHHILSRSIKDVICRYKTLKGFFVKRKAGWDTHGLPVELGVEKELQITKEDVGRKLSVQEYNQACKKAVMRYTEKWNELTHQMGYWTDTKNPYITYDNSYIESVWWLLHQLYQKKLLYKGYSIQPYSPKAGTGLSSHELNQPGCYRNVKDTTVVAQFEVTDLTSLQKIEQIFNFKLKHKVYFLAWTTTPWTLPSNTALTINEKINYVLIKTLNPYSKNLQYVILAQACVEKQFVESFFEVKKSEEIDQNFDQKKIPYFICGSTLGKNLLELRYEQLLKYALPYQNADNAFRVISGSFVTTSDGTGIVHTAPTFGADDLKVAQQHQVPSLLVLDEDKKPVPLVDLQGKFRPEMKELAGLYVKNEYYADSNAPDKSVDVLICIRLKEEDKAFKIEKYEHNYPHCWRTDKPVLYYPLDSWFVKVADHREKLLKLNNQIRWIPESTGRGRFGNWLENASDWNLSRSRFWGIPLPIWRSEDEQEEICIDSIEALKKACLDAVSQGIMSKNPFENLKDEEIDLHKPFVDQIILVGKSGKPLYREADLIDVWFDSGAMPYAQQHFPFSKKTLTEDIFPADFIAEGVDQTRGWFYTLHVIAALCFDQVAYKTVLSHGLVLDKNGQKMSKRLGNTIDPFETLDKFGADATRWYMISQAVPGENVKFDLEGISEIQRKFFRALHNSYGFFALYANLDGFTYAEKTLGSEQRSQMDRWILSRLNRLIANVDEAFSNFDATTAARLIQDFTVDELSNWYVRLCRRRFWRADYAQDKIAAYQTLYECLEIIAILSAPIAPFYTDQLFQDLNNGTQRWQEKSIHLLNFPKFDVNFLDENLEKQMNFAQQIVSMVLSLRKLKQINVRQPLQKIILPILDPQFETEIKAVQELILAETNVKEIIFLQDISGMFKQKIQANFRSIGSKYGQQMKKITAWISTLSPEQIRQIDQQKQIHFELDGENFVLERTDFVITTEDVPGFTVAVENGITVGLDLHLTESLLQEGCVRELVNRIQNYRKDSEFEVTDRIVLTIESGIFVTESIKANEEYLKNEVLADQIIFKKLEISHIEDEIHEKVKIRVDLV